MSQYKCCVLCNRAAGLLCSKCSDSYCSSECQKADWKAHRQICFKMPSLVPDMDAFEQMLSGTLTIQGPNIIQKPKLDVTPPKIPARLNLQTPPQRLSKVMDKVVVKEKVEPTVVTNKSQEIAGKKVEVSGKKLEEAKEQLEVTKEEQTKKLEVPVKAVSKIETNNKTMPPKQKEVPEITLQQASRLKVPFFPAVARGPMKFSSTGDTKKVEPEAKKIQPEMNKIEPKVQKIEPEVKKIQPEDKKVEPEVGKADSEVKKIVKKPDCLMLSDLKKVAWSEGKNVKVKIVATLEQKVFTMCEFNEKIEEYYEMIQQEVSKFCAEQKRVDYLPCQGELVFGLFEGEWYRAHVLDPHPKGTIVQYIDYGNLATLNLGEMIPAPKHMNFDVYARDFIVENVPEQLNEKQTEILSSGVVTITNIRLCNVDNLNYCKIFGF